MVSFLSTDTKPRIQSQLFSACRVLFLVGCGDEINARESEIFVPPPH
uniref:Uncharacterized protein n=1 Tax=Arundo donax TaxID=35708 RepID=A0A0A9BEH3_ARUDO